MGDDDVDDKLLFVNGERPVDAVNSELDGGGGDGGARFSFCNSFKWDVPLIIVELNWEVWWSEVTDSRLGAIDVVVLDEDDRSSSSASSHKLTLANVEQSCCRSIMKNKITDRWLVFEHEYSFSKCLSETQR